MYYIVENEFVELALQTCPKAVEEVQVVPSEYARVMTSYPWLFTRLKMCFPDRIEQLARAQRILTVQPIKLLARLRCLTPHPMRGELVQPDSLIVVVQGVVRPSIVGKLVSVANQWRASYVSFDRGANPWSRDALVASEGAIVSTSTHAHGTHVDQFVRYLAQQGVEVVTLVAEDRETPGVAEYPWDVELRRRPLAIVVGNRDGNLENKGVEEHTHQFIKLPPEAGTGIAERLESVLHEVQIQTAAR